MLNVVITNLGAYNEGELRGKWFDLEDYDSFDDLEESDELKSIGIGESRWDGTEYEEWFVTDFETDIPWISYEEYPGVKTFDEWCESATLWADMPEHVRRILHAYDRHEGINDLVEAEEVVRKERDGEIFLHANCDKEDIMRRWYGEGVIFCGLGDEEREEMYNFIDWGYVADAYGQELSEVGGDVLEIRW